MIIVADREKFTEEIFNGIFSGNGAGENFYSRF